MKRALCIVMILLVLAFASMGCQRAAEQTASPPGGEVTVSGSPGGGGEGAVTVKTEGEEGSAVTVKTGGGGKGTVTVKTEGEEGSAVTVKTEGGGRTVEVTEDGASQKVEVQGSGDAVKVEESGGEGGEKTVSVVTGEEGTVQVTTSRTGDKVTSVTRTSGGETATYSASQHVNPAELPVKLLPGAETVRSHKGAANQGDKSSTGTYVELATTEPVEKVKAFYKSELGGAMEVDVKEQGKRKVILTKVDMSGNTIAVQITEGEGGKTRIMISSVTVSQ